jgi:iron-sulfur cluster assembly accessory protein
MIVDASARTQLDKILQPGEYFRVSIEAGGCSGFEKSFSTCSHTEADDTILHGQVVVDEMSWGILSLSVLTYQQDLSGSRFELKIPQAASECGCGMSFDFKW